MRSSKESNLKIVASTLPSDFEFGDKLDEEFNTFSLPYFTAGMDDMSSIKLPYFCETIGERIILDSDGSRTLEYFIRKRPLTVNSLLFSSLYSKLVPNMPSLREEKIKKIIIYSEKNMMERVSQLPTKPKKKSHYHFPTSNRIAPIGTIDKRRKSHKPSISVLSYN